MRPSRSQPHREGHVVDPQAIRQPGLAIDQDGEFGLGFFHPRPGGLGALHINRNGDDLEIILALLRIHFLPPGQLLATRSPRRPREEQHTLATQFGKGERLAVEIG
jgi:hypothetical protein